VGHRILAGPVDLGGAAQGVGILDPGAAFVGRDDLTGFGQAEHVLRGHQLARVGTDLVDARVELAVGAHEHFQGHGAGDVRHLGQAHGVVHHQGADGGHHLGAVDQGQSLTRRQNQRGSPIRSSASAPGMRFPR
jgi:hypothetical protein